MQFLVMSLIVVATTFDFLVSRSWLPAPAKYFVELFGAVVFLCVVAAGARDRFRNVRPVYWLLFGAIVLVMMCGVLANRVESGPLFAGLRNFARAIPLFFLPAVIKFSERQIKSQLWLLLGILLLQVPLAVHQRMAGLAAGGVTGDTTYGTLMISSFLSIFLICGVAVLVGLYLRKLIRFRAAFVLFVVLLVPTTINETKGTVILLPIALLTVFLVAAKPGTRTKNFVFATLILCTFGAAFIPIYDYLIMVRHYPVTIGEMISDPGKLSNYLSKRDAQIGATEKTGRLDSIVVPWQVLAKDPARLVFGLGPGNASHSSLGPKFTGRYNYLLEPFMTTTFAVIVSELGALGLCLVLALYWKIFSDCRAVAGAANPLMGGIALGWAGVTGVMLVSIAYKNLIPSAALSFLFWYLSGVVAAERQRLAYAVQRSGATTRR